MEEEGRPTAADVGQSDIVLEPVARPPDRARGITSNFFLTIEDPRRNAVVVVRQKIAVIHRQTRRQTNVARPGPSDCLSRFAPLGTRCIAG